MLENQKHMTGIIKRSRNTQLVSGYAAVFLAVCFPFLLRLYEGEEGLIKINSSFQYNVILHPQDTIIGRNYNKDIRRVVATLRNGDKRTERWFQFRIPLEEYERAVGGITDFTSIRFIRIYLTGFEKPIILRFATLDLVQADWRSYEQSLYNVQAPSTSRRTTRNCP